MRILLFLTVSSLFQGRKCLEKPPINITVYYESYCPDSLEFFKRQLEPTYKKLKDSGIMKLDIIAFGKSYPYETETNPERYTFSCQHGDKECKGNTLLACGKQYIEDPHDFFQFAFCVMGSSSPREHSGSKCSAQVKANYSPIEACIDPSSTEGGILINKARMKQESIDSHLTFVPWILINDKFTWGNLYNSLDGLLEFVCSLYDGSDKPKECP